MWPNGAENVSEEARAGRKRSLRNFIKTRSLDGVFHVLLQIGVLSYILLFPLGESLREISSVMAVAGVLGCYVVDYKGSNLSRFKLRFFLAIFLLLLIYKSLDSIAVAKSLKSLYYLSYESLLLFFPALEFCRKARDVKLLLFSFTILLLYLGLDGVYQQMYGHDFFFSVKKGEYLSGPMKDPHLGTMVSIFLPISLGIVYLVPRSWGWVSKGFLYLVLTFPGWFFLLGSGRRIGWVGVGVAFWLYLLSRYGWLYSLPIVIALSFSPFLGLSRFSLPHLLDDPRIPVWSTVLELFKHNWFLGTGLNTFKEAQFKYNRFVFWWDGEFIDCPHNIYLGFLLDTGVIGCAVFLSVFFGFPIYMLLTYRKIRKDNPRYAGVLLCFLLAFVSFLIAASAGMDFYRPWMMASPMMILGIGIGLSLQEETEI
jgi:O-antigen ligase